jgi:hypothetical protein
MVNRTSFRRRRRDERGAAVFVVVMAITLLTAVGLFAAHSATLVDQAAGYTRLARQTQYFAEYGTLAAAAELGSGAGDVYAEEVNKVNGVCAANAGLSGVPCYVFDAGDLQQQIIKGGGQILVDPTAPDGTPGSFGRNATTSGDFTVELTEPGETQIPGQGESTYVKVTATTNASINPNAAACADSVTSTNSQQSFRAHLLIGPRQP